MTLWMKKTLLELRTILDESLDIGSFSALSVLKS